jgi:putative ABC transport system ATP-binding protein
MLDQIMEKYNMIRTVNLSKIFRTEMVETTALHNVSLEVNKGEFVAVMGPSGCGKSTLLNILGLLDNSDSGEYYFDGTEVSRFSEKQRTNLRKGNIGFIFQSFNLIDDLNIYENVELPLLALGEPLSMRRAKVNEILEKMRIGHRKNHFPRQLSGGQQQRVAIARALITRPKIILADEPTGNLDSTNGEQVMLLLEELNVTGTTIIMVTHSLGHAERAHRIVNLFDGHLVMERSDKLFEPIS